VLRIEVPPLRARGSDISLLAETFLRQCKTCSGRQLQGFDHQAMSRLISDPWPGNVRELFNAIEGAVALARGDVVGLDDLPGRLRRAPPTLALCPTTRKASYPTLAQMESTYVQEVLESVGGRKAEAARILGVDRKTLYRKLREHDTGAWPDPEHPHQSSPEEQLGDWPARNRQRSR
jgi:two-component system response regulator HydG